MNLHLIVFFSRNDLPKVNKGAEVIILDEHKSIGTHRIALLLNSDNVIYLDSFGVEYIPKEM